MAGIKNLATVRNLVLDCAPIDNPGDIRALFADSRLRPFRNGLPDLNIDRLGRADALIAYLADRKNVAGENGLTLFWQVLMERIDPGDYCYPRLQEALQETAGSPPPAPSTPPVTSSRQQRKCQDLQAQFNLLSEKLARLTKAFSLETNPAIKLQLEEQVNEATKEREKVEAEMDRLGCV